MAKHTLTTTAQVERTYEVDGDSKEQAHSRLRQHFKDADSLKDGVVVEVKDKQRDSTAQRVTSINGDPVGKAEEAPAAPAGGRAKKPAAGSADGDS